MKGKPSKPQTTTDKRFSSDPADHPEWFAALRIIEVARDIREICFGGSGAFPKAELDDALSAFDALKEIPHDG